MKTPYNLLLDQIREIATLGSIQALLGWDQETMMPPGAIQSRAHQQGLVATLIHQRLTSESYASLIESCLDVQTGVVHTGFSPSQTRTLHVVYRDWRLARCLPDEYIKRFSTASSLSQHVWSEAKKTKCFATFAPHLETMVALAKERAQYLNTCPCPYDTLLDEYEPGLRYEHLVPLVAQFRDKLPSLLKKISSHDHLSFRFEDHRWDLDKQAQWCRQMVSEMGFSFNTGRLDVSSHPFSTNIHAQDVRITTRYREDTPMDALSGSMHEAGHALYEQGLPADAFGTPAGQANSFGIHESQSRFWENCIGKHPAFWEGVYPDFQRLFPENLATVSLEDFYEAVVAPRASLIRVDADEISYNLHIVIRLELERALITGNLAINDLPSAWNEAYKQMFGLMPPDDGLGVLQDVHWSCGYFGYFPTYSVGNVYAAMLLEACHKALPNFETLLRTRQLAPITQWLRTHIHAHGRLKSAAELIQDSTGYTQCDPTPFVTYLTQKYDRV